MNLLYFVLVSFGLTQILVHGKIFQNIRPTSGWLGMLFHCSMCMGFWVGVFLWSVNGFTELISFDYSLVTGFLLGSLSSGTSYILDVIIGDEGIKVDIPNKKKKICFRRLK